MTQNELWTIEEVATLLRVHPETVRRWVRSGRMQAVRLGDGPKAPIRIDQAEVDRFSGASA